MINYTKYQQLRTKQLEILLRDSKRVLNRTTPLDWIHGVYRLKYDEYKLEWEEINGRKYNNE